MVLEGKSLRMGVGQEAGEQVVEAEGWEMESQSTWAKQREETGNGVRLRTLIAQSRSPNYAYSVTSWGSSIQIQAPMGDTSHPKPLLYLECFIQQPLPSVRKDALFPGRGWKMPWRSSGISTGISNHTLLSPSILVLLLKCSQSYIQETTGSCHSPIQLHYPANGPQGSSAILVLG